MYAMITTKYLRIFFNHPLKEQNKMKPFKTVIELPSKAFLFPLIIVTFTVITGSFLFFWFMYPCKLVKKQKSTANFKFQRGKGC